MRRRTAVINGVLALALAGTATGGWLAIGNPSTATAAADSQTTRVSRGTVTSTVTASGNAASADSRSVDFVGVSGTIDAIYVKVGDRVAKGARLAKLDDADAKATLRTAQASLASAKAQLATSEAGQTSAERSRDAAQVSAQQVSVNNASAQLSAARATYSLDTKQQNAIVAAARSTLAAARAELADDKARLNAANTALDRANAGTDASAKQTAQTNVTTYQNQVTQDETAVTQAISSLAQAERTRESTLLRDSQSVTSQSGQLASARQQLASQQASTAVNSQPAKQGPIAQAKAQVASAQVQVDTAQDSVDAVVLLAPIGGTVSAINGSVGGSSGGSTGGSASGSTTTAAASTSSSGLISLTDVSDLQVTAQVAEADAVKVKLNQSATATFSAAGLTVAGTVTAIDVKQTITNNVVTYGVTVSLTSPPSTLRIGQTASISIVAGTKTNVLRVASNAVTTRGTQSTVTVRKDGKDSVVTVRTGLTGDGGTEISSGVSEGDTLVLPATTGAGGGFTFPGGGIGGGLGGGPGR